jgi:hypothetical protein
MSRFCTRALGAMFDGQAGCTAGVNRVEIDKLIARLQEIKAETGTNEVTVEVSCPSCGSVRRASAVNTLQFRDSDMVSWVALIIPEPSKKAN